METRFLVDSSLIKKGNLRPIKKGENCAADNSHFCELWSACIFEQYVDEASMCLAGLLRDKLGQPYGHEFLQHTLLSRVSLISLNTHKAKNLKSLHIDTHTPDTHTYT